jgi:hypothetical protein
MVLLKLILAHLLGDFLFQTKQIVILKNTVRNGAWAHYLVVFGCNCLLLINRLNEPLIWLGILAISLSHILFDQGKIKHLKNKPEDDTLRMFLVDQLLHLIVILVVAWWWLKVGLSFPSDSLTISLAAWAILGIINTYFLSLLLYYIEKSKLPKGYNREYRKMLVRLLIGVSVFMGLIPLTLVVLLVYFIWLYRIKVRQAILVQALAGNCLALLFSWGIQMITGVK